MVGGFLVDNCAKGHSLARAIIKCLQRLEACIPGLSVSFDLCFIMGANSQPHPQYPHKYNLPMYRNAAYCVKDGTVRPCRSWKVCNNTVPEATFRMFQCFVVMKVFFLYFWHPTRKNYFKAKKVAQMESSTSLCCCEWPNWRWVRLKQF